MKAKPKFRVHSLDKQGHVVSKRYLKSGERSEAVREAMMLAVDCSQEVWRGHSLIVHIDPRQGPAPLNKRKARRLAR